MEKTDNIKDSFSNKRLLDAVPSHKTASLPAYNSKKAQELEAKALKILNEAYTNFDIALREVGVEPRKFTVIKIIEKPVKKTKSLCPPIFLDTTFYGTIRSKFQSDKDITSYLSKFYSIPAPDELKSEDLSYREEQRLIRILQHLKRKKGWYTDGEYRWIVHEFVERKIKHDNRLSDFETQYTDTEIYNYNGSYDEGKSHNFKLCGNNCDSPVMVQDSVIGESYCPECGFVKEHYIIEAIKFPPYSTPGGDENNLERNGTYGDWSPYTKGNWKSPRNSITRPKYKGRFYHDRLIDALDTKNKTIFGRGRKSYYEKTLKKRVQNAGYGNSQFEWWNLKRSRPSTTEGERKKKRFQRFAAYELNLRNYCNEHNLPRWVYNESVFILKKIPAKFKMNQLHSRLGDEEKYGRRTVGVVLYVLERRSPKHPLLSTDDTLTSAQYEVLKRNLHRLLYDCRPLPLY